MFIRYRALKKLTKQKNCEVKFSRGKVLIMHSGEPLLKCNIWKLILYLTLGIGMIQACVLKSPNGIVYASEGNVICTKGGNYTLPATVHTLTLVKNYDTAEWKLQDYLTWGCVGGTCPYIENCIESNKKQPMYLSKSNEYSKEVCKDFPNVCLGGRGCIYGKVTLSIYNKISVYSIESISNVYITYSKALNCSFEIYHNTPNFMGEHSLDNMYYWYCPSHSPEGLTLKRHIGRFTTPGK